MRAINTHKVNGCNEVITVEAVDAPGAGGANHDYWITYPLKITEQDKALGILKSSQTQTIRFQNGPIKENGTNGITQEVLLAILIDRLEGFQSGKFACERNQNALNHLREALEDLHDRTLERVARGVEGTHTV